MEAMRVMPPLARHFPFCGAPYCTNKVAHPFSRPPATARAVKKIDQLLPGILLTVFAGTCFATMDAIGKTLSGVLPIIMIVWGRYFFQTVIAAGYLTAVSRSGFIATHRPLLQFLRGAALLTATLLLYTSLAHVPLADATSAMFFSPILVALFSAVFLREKIGIHRIAAIVAGFGGVLLIVRPGAAGTSVYILLPVAAAGVNAAYLMLTRLLAEEQERRAAQFHTTSVGAVVLTLAVMPVWQTPAPAQFAAIALMGVLGTTGHLSLLRAFRHAPASLLSPYLYSQVLFAMLISVFWFSDPVLPATLAGTVLLIASGVYIWWRERRQAATP